MGEERESSPLFHHLGQIADFPRLISTGRLLLPADCCCQYILLCECPTLVLIVLPLFHHLGQIIDSQVDR